MLSPSLRATLMRDLVSGHWGPPTLIFWQTVLSASGADTPGLLHQLQRAFHTRHWDAVTWISMQRVFPTATPGVLETMRQDFALGRWQASTLAYVEALL